MKIVNRINGIIIKFEEAVLASSILIMSLTLIGNVLGRMFFQKGIYAAEEIGQYCIYAVTFIGLSYAVTTGKHINMLGLFDLAPKKFQKIDALVISAVTGVTMAVLTGITWRYVISLKALGKISINLKVPTYLVVAVISLGFLFATLQYILIFIKNLTSEEVYLGLNEVYVPDFRKEEKPE